MIILFKQVDLSYYFDYLLERDVNLKVVLSKIMSTRQMQVLMTCQKGLTSQHTGKASQCEYLTSQHKDLTSQHKDLTTDKSA